MDEELADILRYFEAPKDEHIELVKHKLKVFCTQHSGRPNILSAARQINHLAIEKIFELSGYKIEDLSFHQHGSLVFQKIAQVKKKKTLLYVDDAFDILEKNRDQNQGLVLGKDTISRFIGEENSRSDKQVAEKKSVITLQLIAEFLYRMALIFPEDFVENAMHLSDFSGLPRFFNTDSQDKVAPYTGIFVNLQALKKPYKTIVALNMSPLNNNSGLMRVKELNFDRFQQWKTWESIGNAWGEPSNKASLYGLDNSTQKNLGDGLREDVARFYQGFSYLKINVMDVSTRSSDVQHSYIQVGKTLQKDNAVESFAVIIPSEHGLLDLENSLIFHKLDDFSCKQAKNKSNLIYGKGREATDIQDYLSSRKFNITFNKEMLNEKVFKMDKEFKDKAGTDETLIKTGIGDTVATANELGMTLKTLADWSHSSAADGFGEASENNERTIVQLLGIGANPNVFDPAKQEYAIHRLLCRYRGEKHDSIDSPAIKALIENDADLLATNWSGELPSTIAYMYSNFNLAKSLCELEEKQSFETGREIPKQDFDIKSLLEQGIYVPNWDDLYEMFPFDISDEDDMSFDPK